jgi:hypothetical protein
MKNAQCEHVVCDAHDQPAASAPRRGLGLGHEFPVPAHGHAGRSTPERVDLAASAQGAAGGTYHDLASVVANEDPEVFLFAHSDGGSGEFSLEQCKIARIGLILDSEVIRVAHWWLPCRRLGGERLFERSGVVEVGAENAAAPDLYAQHVVSTGSHWAPSHAMRPRSFQPRPAPARSQQRANDETGWEKLRGTVCMAVPAPAVLKWAPNSAASSASILQSLQASAVASLRRSRLTAQPHPRPNHAARIPSHAVLPEKQAARL